MDPYASVLALFLLAAPTPPAPSPSPGSGPVIIFLVDNSASLPPLDPDEKRVAALEKMFTFLQGQRYRLVLFGGRQEVYVDDVTRYRNTGQWTDFYFAFVTARELMEGYPKGTEFRLILVTDAIPDPSPADWANMGVPRGENLRAFSVRRTVELVREMATPLYVILVGDPPKEGVAPGDREQAPGLIMDLVRAANGTRATPMAQTLASFFGDDGVLLKKFVFRVAPQEGLKKIEPVVRRISAPPRPGVELQFLSLAIVPLGVVLLFLLGALVRSFPGPGDVEIVELSMGSPVHLAADRVHKLPSGGWGGTGLSLVGNTKDAVATLIYRAPSLDLTGVGLDLDGAEPLLRRLLPLSVDEMRRAMEELSDNGSKDEKIFVLNLDYMAKNLEPSEAERILAAAPADRRRTPCLDFLRAKAHLISNDALRRKLTEPKINVVGYGKEAERKDLAPGAPVRIGRYGFVVKDASRGGRKDVRLVLYYDRVPSLLGLKTLLPDAFQRAFRFRRSSQRIVS
jgi:hypothetical protein